MDGSIDVTVLTGGIKPHSEAVVTKRNRDHRDVIGRYPVQSDTPYRPARYAGSGLEVQVNYQGQPSSRGFPGQLKGQAAGESLDIQLVCRPT